jgi:glycosyltransferase involved in cell wall biosynthesis
MVVEMDVRLKVLMIIPNLGMGGAQRSFIKLANWLSEQHLVTVVVFDQKFENIYPTSAAIHFLGKPSGNNVISKGINFFYRLNKLRKIKRRLQPDISISFLEGADYLNMITGAGEKKIISIRGSKKYDPHIKGIQGTIRKKFLIPFFYRKADRIVTASIGLANEISEEYPSLKDKLDIIPNGYLISNALPTKHQIPYFILGWSGRFGDEKGLTECIEIFKRCHDENNSFRLLLLGKGPLQNRVESYFLNNKKRIISCGQLHENIFASFEVVVCNTDSQYEQILGLSDLFLLTSPSEGFPNVIIDAMQLGIPILSTDCRWGPREILAPSIDYSRKLSYPYYGQYGVLLPVLNANDGSAISTWVRTVLSLKDDAEKLSQYQEKSAQGSRLYDQSVIKHKWFDLLQQ